MSSLSSLIRLLLLFILAAFILIFFYVGLYVPKEQSISNLQKDTQLLEKKLLTLKQKQASLKEAQATKVRPTLEVPTELIHSFPDNNDIPELLSSWTRQGKKMEIEFLLFKPLEENNLGPLIEMPIEITLRGTYQQTLAFFNILASSQRKILLSNIEMSRPENKNGLYVISTHAMATTFRKGAP